VLWGRYDKVVNIVYVCGESRGVGGFDRCEIEQAIKRKKASTGRRIKNLLDAKLPVSLGALGTAAPGEGDDE